MEKDPTLQNNARTPASATSRERTSLAHSFRCAGAGVLYVFRTQRNMKIHAFAAALALLLGTLLRIDAPSWGLVILCIALVIALECANTALETVVDLVSPDYHDLAKHAKDCAAGGVLVAAAGSLAIGALVFLPRIVEAL